MRLKLLIIPAAVVLLATVILAHKREAAKRADWLAEYNRLAPKLDDDLMQLNGQMK